MSPNRPSPDQLRDLLRQGDPAAGDPGLSPDELGRMRRVVLDAVPEPRRRLVWAPVLVGVGALIALLVTLGPWRTGETPVPPAPERIAAAQVPPPSPPEPATPPRRIETPVHLVRPVSAQFRRHRPEPVATVAQTEKNPEPRQVQF